MASHDYQPLPCLTLPAPIKPSWGLTCRKTLQAKKYRDLAIGQTAAPLENMRNDTNSMQTRTKHQLAFFPLPHPEAVGAHISILSVSCPVPSSVHPGNRLPVPTSEDRLAPASLIASPAHLLTHSFPSALSLLRLASFNEISKEKDPITNQSIQM